MESLINTISTIFSETCREILKLRICKAIKRRKVDFKRIIRIRNVVLQDLIKALQGVLMRYYGYEEDSVLVNSKVSYDERLWTI